jgi:hypothetical protein
MRPSSVNGQPGVDRCLLSAFQQSFRPLDPPPNRGHESSVEEQVHGDTDRRSCCRKMITHVNTLRVCPFPRTDRHIETTRRVGHTGEKSEVRPIQGRTRVRVDEQV